MSKSKKLTPQDKDQLFKEQFEKSAELEKLLINNDTEKIKEYLSANSDIDFTARVLGLACRYYGLEYVRALAEGGAKFEFKWNPNIYSKYKCYTFPTMVMIVPSDFTIMLLGDVREALTGFTRTTGTFLKNPLPFTDGKSKEMLPFSERLEIVKYLDRNAKKAKFDKNMLYYYSIIADDSEMRTALKEMGAVLPENVKAALTSGDSKGIWQRFCETSDKMTDKQFVNAVNNLSEELDCELYFSAYFQGHAQSKLKSLETFRIILEKFDNSKINRSLALKGIIDADSVSTLELAVNQDWLKQPKKRDEMIDYAVNNKKTECAAYLLDFKNRTADLAAEREKAEKREERELNAAPDSVMMLKKIWGYKKLEDGTLIITSYKGTSTAPVVPERIGKSTVTAIGEYAFSPCGLRITEQIKETRNNITSVTLPKTVTFIEYHAFYCCKKLTEITIPNGVTRIGREAFCRCQALKSITIPESVERLSNHAFGECTALERAEIRAKAPMIPFSIFRECKALKDIVLSESTRYIDNQAFIDCDSIEAVIIPKGVREIGVRAFDGKKLKTVEIQADLDYLSCNSFSSPILEEISITGSVKLFDALYLMHPLKRLTFPEGLEKIVIPKGGELDFISESVTLPRSLKEVIESEKTDNAKHELPKAMFYVPKGSFAEEFCKSRGYKYTVTE